MPHDETLAIVGWLDELRRQIGVRYPFEPACDSAAPQPGSGRNDQA
jgi:hypothetical protein